MVEQVVGLRFVVDGEAEATAKLKKFQAQQEKATNSIKSGAGIAKRLENDIKSLNAALGNGTISQKAFDSAITQVTRSYKMLNEGVRGTSMSIQKATSDVQKVVRAIKDEEKARADLLRAQQRSETAYALAMQRYSEEQAALQREQAERLKLEAMYDRNAVAARVYENAVNNLNRAEQLGVISADRKADELLRLQTAYEQAGTSAARTSNFINQFGEGASVAGIKTNRFGMYAQQVGYQVGDFFVQVQSGTNAFVAFGQQATQLAGLLPGLAGAIVGIGISVATTFLAAWSRASAAIDNTAKSMEHFQNKLSSARDEIIDMEFELERLRRGFDDAREFVLTVDVENAQKRIAEIEQQIYELELMGAPSGPNQRNLEIELARLEAAREQLNRYIEVREETERLTEAQKNGFELVVGIKDELEAAAKVNLAKVFTAANGPAQTVLRTLKDFVASAQAAAIRIQAERNLEAIRFELSPGGQMLERFGGRGAPSRAQSDLAETYDMYGNLIPSKVREAGGGGGTTGLDAVQQLEQQIARTRDLLKLNSEQATLQKEIWRITDALGEDRNKYSDAYIANLVRENLALDEQTRVMAEAYAQQQSIYDQMSSSMEDAFMSIVDGTSSAKDAFRSMAYEIIKELYRVLVVQQMVGSFNATTGVGTGIVGAIGRLFTNANGNAFIGGNVTAFANGGVVGGPTMFPMSGGRTGLMGEAGPEAIMPLKRTSSGKLGVVAEGGGGVVVNNNINVSGDNAAAVRQEVAKLMPTITEATKSAVIDARRRGGQMKAAFS